MKIFIQSLMTFIILLTLDFIWFALYMKRLAIQELGGILRMSNGSIVPHWPTFVGVYLLMTLGLQLFVFPKLPAQGGFEAFAWGGIFGSILFGIFDLTNYSILTVWPLRFTIVDICWGTFLCGFVSFIINIMTRNIMA